MIKFLKWLFKINKSEMIMTDWLTEEETKTIDDNNKEKMYKICHCRKQLNDNMRDLAWISIAIIIIVGILTYHYTTL